MFGRMRQTKGWEHNGRVLAEDLLVIALDGQAEFTFHDQRHPVHRGDVLYIPANTWYQAYSADYLDYYFFHFCGGRVSSVSEEECRRFKEYEDQLQTASTRAFYLPQTDYHLLIDSQVSLGEQFDHVLYYISKCQGCLVQMDYYKKLALYQGAGVREYWIIDPAREVVMVYDLANETPPTIYRFTDSVKVNIYEDFSIDFSQLKL